MSKYSFCIGLTIASSFMLIKAAIALPLPIPSPQKTETSARVENPPICYIQFQGSGTINVSNVCGKNPAEASAKASAIVVSNPSAPPIFDPSVTNASTTGQCNFVDANGTPCPQK